MKGKKFIVLLCAAVMTCNMTVYAAPPFDSTFYAAAYPDVAAVFGNDADALERHYHSYGVAEGRVANAEEAAQRKARKPVSFEEFDAAYYAAYNPDVVAVFGSEPKALYDHYLRYGAAEGRAANAEEAAQREARKPVSFEEFDAVFYAARNPDVVAAFGSDPKNLYAHYLLYGAAEGRLPKVFQTPTPISAGGADDSGSSGHSGSSQSAVTHILRYTSNGDGTHTITCSVNGCTENGHSGTDTCYEVNNSCRYCKQALTHTLTYTYQDNGTHYCACSLAGCHQSGHNTTVNCVKKYTYKGKIHAGKYTHTVTCDVCGGTIIAHEDCKPDGKYKKSSQYHYKNCEMCEHRAEDGESHEYNTTTGYCTVCGYQCAHDFDGNRDYCPECGFICTHPSWSEGRCTVCIYPHSEASGCTDSDHDGKCDTCGGNVNVN